MLKKYRKKPIIIEAVQFHNQMITDDCIPEGVYIVCTDKGDKPVIHTLEGDMIVSDGDYVITGVNGEKYPCKPDIFEKTYDPLN